MSLEQHDWDKFYHWVGLCITQWAGLESKLFRICHSALGAEKHIAAVVFFRTPTFDARLSLVSELLKAAFPRERRDGGHDHDLVVEYEKIVSAIRPLWDVRNLLAHGVVGGGGNEEGEWWINIRWHIAEALRPRGAKPRTEVRHTELEDYSREVADVHDRLILLMHNVLKERPTR